VPSVGRWRAARWRPGLHCQGSSSKPVRDLAGYPAWWLLRRLSRQRGAGGLVRAGDGLRPSSVVRKRRCVGPRARLEEDAERQVLQFEDGGAAPVGGCSEEARPVVLA
jgi:hypothetical protein